MLVNDSIKNTPPSTYRPGEIKPPTQDGTAFIIICRQRFIQAIAIIVLRQINKKGHLLTMI